MRDLLNVPGLGPAKVARNKAAFRLGKLLCAGKSAAVSFESLQAIADYIRPRFTSKRSIFREIHNQRSLQQVQVETGAAAQIEQQEQIDWSFRG